MGDAPESQEPPTDPRSRAPRGARDAAWDPEERWSVGAAADRAGVTHNELIEWVRRGDLEVETIRRDGVEIRVVRAGDVAALAPAAAEGASRAGASAPAEPPERAGSTEDEVDPGAPARTPDHAAADADPIPEPAAALPVGGRGDLGETADIGAPAAPAPGRSGPAPAEGASAAALDALRDEVARLRAELDAPRTPFAHLSAPPAFRRMVALAAAVGALVGVAAGLLIGDIDGGGGRGEAAPDARRPAAVHAASPDASLGGADGPPAPLRPRAERAPSPAEAVDVPPVLDGDGAIDAQAPDDGPSGIDPGSGAAGTSDAPPPATGVEGGGAPAPAADGGDAAAIASRPLIAPPPWERDLDGPRYLDEVAVQGDGATEPCAYRALLAGEDAAPLLALGPCYGAPGAGEGGEPRPRGTHRVAGVHACAHHAFVERVTRASRDADARTELAEEAEAALAQGLAPPLLRLRAERAAGAFLADIVGAWVECGLDGRPPRDGSRAQHAWTPPRIVRPEGGARAIEMTLRSWMRVEESGPLRAFEIDVVLVDGPRGDRLDGLRWPATEPAPADER